METNTTQTSTTQATQQQNAQVAQQAAQTTPPAFDYDKLAGIIAGKQTATEDTVLRGYFKQQGLTKEEMDQAINAFKQQKAANQPDVNALQGQITAAQQAQQAAQEAAVQAQIQAQATMVAVSLGIDTKTIPYVLKMADLSQAAGQDGKINEESLKTALGKVLEDIPALKGAQTSSAGFVQIGTDGRNTPQQTSVDEQLDRIFGVKK